MGKSKRPKSERKDLQTLGRWRQRAKPAFKFLVRAKGAKIRLGISRASVRSRCINLRAPDESRGFSGGKHAGFDTTLSRAC